MPFAPSTPPLTRRLRRAWAELRYFGFALRNLRWPLAQFTAAWALGTVVERGWGAPLGGLAPSWDAAAYTAFMLLLGELNAELPADPAGQLILYLFPLLGVIIMAEGLVKVGLTVFRKAENAGVWMEILANATSGHIILVGLGQVGFRTLEQLLAMGAEVFVVEADANGEHIATARALAADGRPVHLLLGDARQEKLIRSLNPSRARAVVIATDDDLVNLEVALEVQEAAPEVNVVMRLFDQRLANRVKNAMGVDVSLSTSAVAAPIFAAAALDRRVVGAHRVGERTLLVVEVGVATEAVGETAGQFYARTGHALVALNGTPARANQVLAPGDTLQVLVPAEELASLPSALS